MSNHDFSKKELDNTVRPVRKIVTLAANAVCITIDYSRLEIGNKEECDVARAHVSGAWEDVADAVMLFVKQGGDLA